MFLGRWSLSSCDHLMHLCSLHSPLLTASGVSALPCFLFSGQRFDTRHSFVCNRNPKEWAMPYSTPIVFHNTHTSHCQQHQLESLRASEDPTGPPWGPLVPYRTPQRPCSVTGRNTGQCWVTNHSRGQPVWGCDFESRMCQPMGAPLSEEGSEHLDCSPPTDFSQPESGSYVQPLCSFSLLG